MSFLPNCRASTDQAPGPIIARVTPRVARIKGIQEAVGRDKRIQPSVRPTSVPTKGVHNPIKINIPKPAAMSSGKAANHEASVSRLTAQLVRTAAVSARCNRSPRPGQPFAKFEKRRCNSTSSQRLGNSQQDRNGRKEEYGIP